MKELKKIKEILDDAEMILIGIGSELEQKEDAKADVDAAYAAAAKLVKGRNYFVLTGNTDQKILDKTFYPSLVCAINLEGQEKNWNGYLNWLTASLGHRLVILELGEGFRAPEQLRWPFEKTVMINQKATLIRVGRQFPQVPKELGERAISLREDAGEFICALLAL